MSSQIYDQLTQELFESQLDALYPCDVESDFKIALALSGGQDSTVLLDLLNKWSKKKRVKFYVFTVDHKLREDSTGEALKISRTLKGICHHEILTWQHNGISTGLQEKARKARYDLLLQKCKEHGVQHLYLAHHLDDQIETFFQRLEKKSGLHGLVGMSKVHEREGVQLLRPLLAFTKNSIEQYAQQQRLEWIEDPSNNNPLFSRFKIRYLTSKIKNKTDFYNLWEKLHSVLMRAHQQRCEKANIYISHNVELHELGFFRLEKEPLCDERIETQKDILSHLVCALSGRTYPISTQTLDDIILENYPAGKKFCIGGCKILFRKNELLIIREYHDTLKRNLVAESENDLLWDSRFLLEKSNSFTLSDDSLLGPDKWQNYKNLAREVYSKSVPEEVFWTLPVIKNLDGSEWVPYLNKYSEVCEKDTTQIRLYLNQNFGMTPKI